MGAFFAISHWLFCCQNSERGQGAEVSGDYWGRTCGAYWGARSVFNSQLSTLNSIYILYMYRLYLG